MAAAGEDIDLGPQVGMLRWIVNLTADGALVFAGQSFPFDDADEAKAKVMRRTAAKELAREWKKAHAGHEHLGLLVRADCRNPWGRVHLLLAWVLGVVDSVDAIHFAVDTGAVRDGAPLDGRIEVLSREPGPASNPTITADLIDVGGAKQPRIVWGERTWTFPGGDPYAAGPGLDEANATWDSILAALRAVPGTPRPILRLAFDPRVPWSHVAQFLGLVRLAGIPNVDLVRERLALTLSTPPPDLALRTGGRARVRGGTGRLRVQPAPRGDPPRRPSRRGGARRGAAGPPP